MRTRPQPVRARHPVDACDYVTTQIENARNAQDDERVATWSEVLRIVQEKLRDGLTPEA
jgi:hypothetical protein